VSSTGTALVTGGSGFIGRRLVHQLLARGTDVRVLDRQLPPIEVAAFVGDVRDAKLVDKAVHGVDTIYHLAAAVGARASVENASEVVDVNARGTALLLDAAERHGVDCVVLASSVAVFGDTSSHPDGRADVNHPRRPVSPYGASKLAAEGLLWAFAASSPARTAVARLTSVYGPEAREDQAVGRFLKALQRGRTVSLFGDGTSTRDYLHVDDACRELRRAASQASRQQPHVRHGATGVATSLRELVELLQEISGRSADLDVCHPQPGDPHTCLARPTDATLPGGARRSLRAGLEELWSR